MTTSTAITAPAMTAENRLSVPAKKVIRDLVAQSTNRQVALNYIEGVANGTVPPRSGEDQFLVGLDVNHALTYARNIRLNRNDADESARKARYTRSSQSSHSRNNAVANQSLAAA
jgi:hypothetical protein